MQPEPPVTSGTYRGCVHIRELHVANFKCFSELGAEIPGRPRLVVLCGENGTGKSSVIDAIASWRLRQHFGISDPAFFTKGGDTAAGLGPGDIQLVFHEGPPADTRAAVYVRTAQRLTVEFAAPGMGALQRPRELAGPMRTIDLDDRVAENYQRLVAASINALWDREARDRPIGEIVDELVGRIDEPLGRLLPGLRFDGPDRPLEQQSTFRFSKGASQRYAYKHLSGGEKAAFDLLLDATLKSADFDEAVWCIDEPELHVNPRIQGQLLNELVGLLGPNAQLWIAGHSAGMLAQARRLQEGNPEDVVFLDLGDADPDQPIMLAPVDPGRPFWRRQLSVALGDLAELMAPSTVVLCEGRPDARDRPRAQWDARVLERIFAPTHTDIAFVSVGNANDVIGDRMDVGAAIEALIDGTQVLRVIDRDARSADEVRELREAGCRVLRRRHLEAYLLDDETLDALCERNGVPEQRDAVKDAMRTALESSEARGNAADDYKSAAGEFVTAVRSILALTTGGNTAPAFLRDTIAPCIRPDMAVYRELREDIFGNA